MRIVFDSKNNYLLKQMAVLFAMFTFTRLLLSGMTAKELYAIKLLRIPCRLITFQHLSVLSKDNKNALGA